MNWRDHKSSNKEIIPPLKTPELPKLNACFKPIRPSHAAKTNNDTTNGTETD